MVRAAVQQSSSALLYASPLWRGDKPMVLAALQHSGWSLRDAAEHLRDDREVRVCVRVP